MIVPEQILETVFSQLPNVIDRAANSYAVHFAWGGEKDLNPYLIQISGAKYPLLWLVEGTDNVDHYAHTLQRDVKLFIAIQSEDTNALNQTVWNREFAETLNPLLVNVIKCLEKSGATAINGKYKVSRRANYTENPSAENSESMAIDNWNVILWEGSVTFSEKADGMPICINTIRF